MMSASTEAYALVGREEHHGVAACVAAGTAVSVTLSGR